MIEDEMFEAYIPAGEESEAVGFRVFSKITDMVFTESLEGYIKSLNKEELNELDKILKN